MALILTLSASLGSAGEMSSSVHLRYPLIAGYFHTDPSILLNVGNCVI